ncbi:hypothetical protein GCM10010486_05210 [Nonomuraea roseoviolacea subsp. carminata]
MQASRSAEPRRRILITPGILPYPEAGSQTVLSRCPHRLVGLVGYKRKERVVAVDVGGTTRQGGLISRDDALRPARAVPRCPGAQPLTCAIPSSSIASWSGVPGSAW